MRRSRETLTPVPNAMPSAVVYPSHKAHCPYPVSRKPMSPTSSAPRRMGPWLRQLITKEPSQR